MGFKLTVKQKPGILVPQFHFKIPNNRLQAPPPKTQRRK